MGHTPLGLSLPGHMSLNGQVKGRVPRISQDITSARRSFLVSGLRQRICFIEKGL